MPSLPAGQYIVFLSDDKAFSQTKIVVYKRIQISNISYIHKPVSNNKTLALYILNRKTGKPVPGANVTVYRQQYNRRWNRYKSVKTGEYTCNNKGFVEIPAENSGYSNRYLLDISKQNQHFYAYETSGFPILKHRKLRNGHTSLPTVPYTARDKTFTLKQYW